MNIDHEVRRLGIGGSEIAALFGVDEYQTAFGVWARKKSGMPREVDDEDGRMLIGKVFEPAVLELYSRLTGREITRPETSFQHSEHRFMIYSPDALITGERRGVEAKVAFLEQRRKWGWEASEIPPRVQLQCFWYMAALDYPVWDVAAFLGDGLPRIYTLDRLDAEHERAMLERAREWWSRYIQGDEQPPFDDSYEASRWLAHVYPAHRTNTIREATCEEAKLLRHYVDVRVVEQQVKAARAEDEAAIKAAIADGEGLRWDDTNVFTWKKTKDSEVLNWESMATALLCNFVKDSAERAALYKQYTTTKPGTRRIYVRHPELKKDE